MSSGGSSSGGTSDSTSGGTSGTTSTGEAGSGGAAPDPVSEEVLCLDANGDPVPYDYSYGIAGEYATELFQNCDIGGYLAPLVAADPDQLSVVSQFISDMTDWYRSRILLCDGSQSSLASDAYGLLPASQSADMTKNDFEAAESLFMMVLDRHDSLPDGVDPQHKQKINARLKSKENKAVKNNKDELTKPLDPSMCVPAGGM